MIEEGDDDDGRWWNADGRSMVMMSLMIGDWRATIVMADGAMMMGD